MTPITLHCVPLIQPKAPGIIFSDECGPQIISNHIISEPCMGVKIYGGHVTDSSIHCLATQRSTKQFVFWSSLEEMIQPTALSLTRPHPLRTVGRRNSFSLYHQTRHGLCTVCVVCFLVRFEGMQSLQLGDTVHPLQLAGHLFGYGESIFVITFGALWGLPDKLL